MKVTLDKEYRRHYLTEADVDAAKQIIKQLREEEAELTIAEAINHFDEKKHRFEKLYEYSAEICRDETEDYNWFFEGSGYINVWIKATVKAHSVNFDGEFIEISFLYSKAAVLCFDDVFRACNYTIYSER